MFNFRKIASVAMSAAILGSTVGVALAANYPAPFVQSGNADVALVYGSTAASSDLVAAIDITNSLQASLSAQSGSSSSGPATVSGEAYALFTGSSPLFLNSSLNAVRTGALTSTELPTLLADGEFNGNVDAEYDQYIYLGSHPRIIFDKQPDNSNDDPTIGLALSTTSSNYAYNMTVIFDTPVAFNHSDSEGESFEMFGQKVSVGADTDDDEIVLFRSSDTIFLSIGGSNPSPTQQITVDGETFTVELAGATATSATIKVTDSSGGSDTKEINEDDSKKIQGVEVAVGIASSSEATGTESAEITVGSQKIILQDANPVKLGVDEDTVTGTMVDFDSQTLVGNVSRITIQVTGNDSNEDAVVPGQAWTDTVFGTFKLDFTGMTSEFDDENRDTISISNSGDDKLKVEFTNHEGLSKSLDYINNESVAARLADNDKDDLIRTIEMGQVNVTMYVVVGNEEEGYLLELTGITNNSGVNDDKVTFRRVFEGTSFDADATSEGVATMTVGGKTYTVNYWGTSEMDSAARYARISYPDSSGDQLVVYPTIESDKGARVAFYEPLTVTLNNYDGLGLVHNVSGFLLPDGNGYTTVTVAPNVTSPGGWVINSALINTSVAAGVSSTNSITVGKLTYNITNTASNQTTIYLRDVSGANIVNPALVIFEGADDGDENNNNEAIIVKTEVGGSSDDGIGVDDAETTWGGDRMPTLTSTMDEVELESNSDLTQQVDYWGTLIETDESESDQKTVKILYPEEQVSMELYAAENSASITGGSSGGGSSIGSITVKDNEVNQVSGKNLVVLGGSCINTVAASLLGSDRPVCGADFTGLTGAGSGQFVIQSFASPYSSSKVALLVAGYNAGDTTNAATYLRNNAVDTMVGKKYLGTSATTAQLVTT